jgi:predicted hydrocarbon binding protein
MRNVFMQGKDHATFSWESLGDIKEGRGSLGEEMPVLVYRLMQFTMLDVLTKDLGREKADRYLYESGFLAGTEFAKNVLDLKVDFDTFVANLQIKLRELKIGILRVESVNQETGEILLTVGEDLDCSGLPITGENVCNYDEGFISGILAVYTGKIYSVREIDCWASGDRVCRFKCTP